MSEKKDISKNYYIDIAKFITIFLMVIGHALQLFNWSEFRESCAYYDNWVYRVIYSFHMPMFMFISGYLYYISVLKSTSGFTILIRRLKQYFYQNWLT